MFDLSLTINEEKVFSYFLINSKSTIVELMRDLSISKTGLYKILDKLVAYNLIYKEKNVFYVKNIDDIYKNISEKVDAMLKVKKKWEDFVSLQKEQFIKHFDGDDAYLQLSKVLRKELTETAYVIYNLDYAPQYLNSRKSQEKYKDNLKIVFTNKRKGNKVSGEKFFPYKNQNAFSSITVMNNGVAFCTVYKGKEKAFIIRDKNISNLIKDLVLSIVR